MTRNILTRLIRDESGATAIEYGLIVALVSIAALGAYQTLGGSLNTLFGNVASRMPTGAAAGGGAGGGAGG